MQKNAFLPRNALSDMQNYFYAGKKEEYYEKASLCVAGADAGICVR